MLWLMRICRVVGTSFLWLVTNVFGYIITKSKGLCGRVMCVLFIWLVGVCLLGVSYGVGVLCLVTWRLLGGRVV